MLSYYVFIFVDFKLFTVRLITSKALFLTLTQSVYFTLKLSLNMHKLFVIFMF